MKQPDRIYVHLKQEPSGRWVCNLETSVLVPAKSEDEFSHYEHTSECSFSGMDHTELVCSVYAYLKRPNFRKEVPSIMDASEISREWLGQRFNFHAMENPDRGFLITFEYTFTGDCWRVGAVAEDTVTVLDPQAVAEQAARDEARYAQLDAALKAYAERRKPDLLALARDLQ